MRYHYQPFIQALTAVCLATASSAALAWGAQGHRIVGAVADAFLTPRARIEVSRILGGESISDAAVWMDQARSQLGPRVAQWHYDNAPVCGGEPPACRDGNCLSVKLPVLYGEIKSQSNPEQRAQALRMVIHLIGDLHQTCKSTDLCSDSSVLL